MALVKYGGGIVQASGSIAGTVHARNRFGNYIRARTKPINPSSARQQTVRGNLATLTARWGQILTPVQRTAWNLYAASVAMKNRLGEVVYLSGFNHYLRSNMWLLDLGGTLVDDGPTIFSLPEKDGTIAITASEATQAVTIAFNDAADWGGEDDAYLVVLFGSPQNPQRNYFKGPWRGIGHLDGVTETPITSPLPVTNVFIMTELQRVWCRFRILRADGRISEDFAADCFCAA